MSVETDYQAIEFLFRSLNGEDHVIEQLEAEENQRVLDHVLMAKKMDPSREEWEKLGFFFSEIAGDDLLYDTKLPEGWSLRSSGGSIYSILDSLGRERGLMYYKSDFYDRKANMFLVQRYGVDTDVIRRDGYHLLEVFFGNKKEKLFIAGQRIMDFSKTRSWWEQKQKDKDLKNLKNLAKSFGDTYYPGWDSIHTYWENDQEQTLKLQKK